MIIFRGTIITITLIITWQLIVSLFHLPPYILPGPIIVIKSLCSNWHLIAIQSIPTIIEALLGLFFGALIGIISALILTYFRPARLWFMPILLISQALPTFAIAPILVVWFGYGISSKILTTMIMLFFPITNAFYDGLRNVNSGWLDLGKTMNAAKWKILWHIKVPAALPNLATGLRVATAIAPIGAIVGEWVGASRGLGFLMLNANARMQIDLMFAVLLVITVFTIVLYFIVDKSLKKTIDW
jgi:putative hydroxymethylpyrimidine transport system permease protein